MNHTAFLAEDCIKTREGFTDYLQLENYAVRKESEEIQRAAIRGLVNLFRGITSDIKLIFMGYAAETKKQISYIYDRSRDIPMNDFVKSQRDHKIWELNKANQKILEDIVYIQIFGRDREELERVRSEVFNGTSKYIHVTELPVHRKKELLYQLYNLGERQPEFDDSLSDSDLLNRAGEDRKFMSEIQPESGITSKENWVSTTGKGYIGVCHLHRFAKKERFYWGESVFRQSGVITTVDISHQEISKVKNKLTKAIGEKEDNAKKGANREIQMDSAIEKQLLEDLLQDMLTSNESVKEVTVRYYFTGKTIEEIHAKVEKINDNLEFKGYKGSLYLGEEDTELKALYRSQTEQKKIKNRKGKELTTTDLGTSYPLNHSQLIDPNGLYFGLTATGGLFVLDMWHKDAQRKSYNFALLGLPGSGKSSALKKIGSHNDMLGNYTYYFMANGENDRFMKEYGGLSIDASGKDGTANMWQIFAVVIDENTGIIDELQSYNVSVNKIKTIMMTMYGKDDTELKNALSKYIESFYMKWFEDHNMSKKMATRYDNDQYPILEDFQKYIREIYKDEKGLVRTTLSNFEAKRLDKIDATIENMMADEQIFNRHTTIDLGSYRSVSFNLGSLLNKDRAIFNAQFYNLLFFVWNLTMVRGTREKSLYEMGKKSIKEVVRSMIILDEFHNITRQHFMDAIDLLDRYVREARKIFAGLGLSTHDILDLFTDSASSEFKEKVHKLLKLCTYTFVMQQDPGSTEALKSAFKDTLKESELAQVPNLEVGETILAIKGKGNFQIKIDLSREEERIFTGGH